MVFNILNKNFVVLKTVKRNYMSSRVPTPACNERKHLTLSDTEKNWYRLWKCRAGVYPCQRLLSLARYSLKPFKDKAKVPSIEFSQSRITRSEFGERDVRMREEVREFQWSSWMNSSEVYRDEVRVWPQVNFGVLSRWLHSHSFN